MLAKPLNVGRRTTMWRRLTALGVALIAMLAVMGSFQTPLPGATAAPDVAVPRPGQSPAVDAIKKRGTMRAGVGISLPWLGQDPSTSQYFGPAVTLGHRIAQLLGVKEEYVPLGWDVMIAGLQSGQIDLIVAPLYATEKRREVVDFVNYAVGGICYAARRDNKKVKDLSSLNSGDVVVGTALGSGTEQAVRAKYPGAKISAVASSASAQRILDVVSRRIDVATFDSPLALVIQTKYPELRIIPQNVRFCMATPDLALPIGMAFSKGDPAFARFLADVAKSEQKEVAAEIQKYSSPQYLEKGFK